MKNRKKIIKTIGILTLPILAITGTSFAYGGGYGQQGGGCHGDPVCRAERQANNQRENSNNQSQRGYGVNRSQNGQNRQHGQNTQIMDQIKNSPLQEILEKEKEYIAHMREEEKIARDVYITLYKKWGIQTFDNISKSEQRHMDAVKTLIDKYELKDSMKSNEVGVFNEPEFQKLYNDLVEKGLKSKVDALQVGMTIEDVDIYDLEKFMSETNNSDIKTIFNNLNNGSTNHMRAFKRQLDMVGGDYKAQYITEDRMNEILSSQNQMGHGHGKMQNHDGMQNYRVQPQENIQVEKQENNVEIGFFEAILNWFSSFWK